MKTTFVTLFLLVCAGCATRGYYLNPELKTFSRQELESAPSIRLPDEFDIEKALKRIVLGVKFTEGGQPISRTLNARLQTELSKLRRFTVVSTYNVNGKLLLMDLADLGELEFKEPEKRYEVNFLLDVELQWDNPSPREDYRTYMRTHRFEAVCDWHLTDCVEQTEVDHGVARGATERSELFSAGLQNAKVHVRGFDGEDVESVEAAKCMAIMKALATVANSIGNKYPVAGEVLAVSPSGERLTMSKGFVDGVGRFQQVAICSRGKKKNGLITPLALGEAMPGRTESNVRIYKWNTDDEDAARFVDAYRKDPRGFAKKHRLVALCYGMAIPVEWENDSTEDDEKMLLGHR